MLSMAGFPLIFSSRRSAYDVYRSSAHRGLIRQLNHRRSQFTDNDSLSNEPEG